MIKYLIIAVVLIVGALMTEKFLLTKGGEEIARTFEAYEKAPRPIKTLILGHCEAASGIAPAYLGKNVFNFAANDRTFYYTRGLLQKVIRKSEVESVILAINPLMFMGKYNVPTYTQRYMWFKKGIVPAPEDLIRTTLSFGNHVMLFSNWVNSLFFKEQTPVNHHLKYSSAFTTVPLQEIKEDTFFMDGFRALTPSYEFYPPEQLVDELIRNVDFSQAESQKAEFRTILSILKGSSIKTTIVLLPQVKGFTDEVEKRVPGTEASLQEMLSSIRTQFPGVHIHDLRSGHGIPDKLFALPYIISSQGADILGPQLAKILNDEHHFVEMNRGKGDL